MMKSYTRLINSCQEICFTDRASGLTIGILAGYGAGLNRFEIPLNGGSFNLIRGYNQKADFKKLYNSVILTPFPNRIKDGQYTFEEKPYQLPINYSQEQHAMHGLLFNKAFTVETISCENNEAHLTLKYIYKGDVVGYPFPFNCCVSYHWRPTQHLTCSINIINTGEITMPLGLGWHPYFTFPSKVNDLALLLNCTQQYQIDDRMIPTLKTKPYDNFQQMRLIGETQLDDCFALIDNEIRNRASYKKKINANTHTTVVEDKANSITLSIAQNTGKNQFNYLQIYTPSDRESIALEPMTCIPDAFNNGIGLVKLLANKKLEVAYKLKIVLG